MDPVAYLPGTDPFSMARPPPHIKPSARLTMPTRSSHQSLQLFYDACKAGDIDTIRNLEPKFHDNADVLTWALNYTLPAGNLEVARYLLQKGAVWDNTTVTKANPEGIKLLIEFGFDVNDSLLGGGVLLTHAVSKNNIAMINLLLSHGANPNCGVPLNHLQATRLWDITPVNNSGDTLNACAAHSTPEVFKLLLTHGAILSNAIPLHRAVCAGGERIEMMEYLVDEVGLDVNGNDDAIALGQWANGENAGCRGTPLMYAVLWRKHEEARWLVSRGADPDMAQPGTGGSSCRDYCGGIGDVEMLRILDAAPRAR